MKKHEEAAGQERRQAVRSHKREERKKRKLQRNAGRRSGEKGEPSAPPASPRPSADQRFNALSDRIGRLNSRVRLSLSLRVALNYGWLFIRGLFTHLFLFVLAFMLICAPPMVRQAQAILNARPDFAAAWEENQFQDLGFALFDQEERLLDSRYPDTIPFTGPGWGLSYDWADGKSILKLSIELSEENETLCLSYDVSERVRMLIYLILTLAALDLLRMIDLISSGRAATRRMLQPINTIAAIAQTLSANNLSARINVEGTKNELRDLATVINEMLDRIEVAYNSQKQFVSDASHELRTPIAVIQGYADMLSRWGKDDPAIRDEAIEAILSESVAMKDLVEKLLFLARHDKRTLKLELAPFEAGELVEELFRDTQLLTQDHQLVLCSVAPGRLLGDRGVLKQALRIFVDNAIKYTPSGGRIAIGSEVQGGYYRIYVEDSGMGIAQDELSRIFDRFYRSDKARGGSVEGHGLGLSIARIIVLSHGGKIEVASRPGAGSRFTMILPL